MVAEILWRSANKTTLKALRRQYAGQYHVGLTSDRRLADFFGRRRRNAAHEFNVTLEPTTYPVPLDEHVITIGYVGTTAQRRDYRISAQSSAHRYPLWSPPTSTTPGTDHLLIVRDPLGRFHGRWLRPTVRAKLPDSVQQALTRRTVGMVPIETTEDWRSVAAALRIGVDEPPVQAVGGTARRSVGTTFRPDDEHPSHAYADAYSIDPDKMRRGAGAHASIQSRLYRHLKRKGIEGKSFVRGVDPPFDLSWQVDGTLYVAEVKSTTQSNAEKQLRVGLGQVLRYSHQLRHASLSDDIEWVAPVLVAEREPSSEWHDLASEVDVNLTWPTDFESWSGGQPE